MSFDLHAVHVRKKHSHLRLSLN